MHYMKYFLLILESNKQENIYQFMPFFRCYSEIYSKMVAKRPFDSFSIVKAFFFFFQNHHFVCILDNQSFIDKTTHTLKNVTIGAMTVSFV